jgi:hypothetical protein
LCGTSAAINRSINQKVIVRTSAAIHQSINQSIYQSVWRGGCAAPGLQYINRSIYQIINQLDRWLCGTSNPSINQLNRCLCGTSAAIHQSISRQPGLQSIDRLS